MLTLLFCEMDGEKLDLTLDLKVCMVFACLMPEGKEFHDLEAK